MCSPYEFPENLWRPLNPPWLGMSVKPSVKPSEFAWCTNCTLDMSNFPWCCHHAIRSRRPVSSQLSLCDVQIVHFEIGVCTNKVHRQCVTHISKFSNPWCLLTFLTALDIHSMNKLYTWCRDMRRAVSCASLLPVDAFQSTAQSVPHNVHIVKFHLGCF